MEPVSLREVTAETVRAVCALTVKPEQAGFVAPNAESIAESHFHPASWFRAVYAGERPVGFLLVYDEPQRGEYHLLRFMIDGAHQGRGYGRRAMELLIADLRQRPGARELTLNHVPQNTGARALYTSVGFEDTGEHHHGECVMRLDLTGV